MSKELKESVKKNDINKFYQDLVDKEEQSQSLLQEWTD